MRRNDGQYLAATLRKLQHQGVPWKLEYWPESDIVTCDIGESLAGYHVADTTPTKALRYVHNVWKDERGDE
jgi:hypothetical protein